MGSTEPTSIGRYELSSTLGVGGFASVHRAYDPALDGDVAIKILLPQYVDNTDIRSRFLQEARLLRRVDSTNLVRVYDIGQLTPEDTQGTANNRAAASSQDTELLPLHERPGGGVEPGDGNGHNDGDRGLPPTEPLTNSSDRGLATNSSDGGQIGRPYFVMELADGGVLTQRVRGPVDQLSMLTVIDALANGLGALHGADVVHRDIKPDNLLIAGAARSDSTQIGGLLAEGERLLIGDLGLAKDHTKTSAGPTVSGGTPRYRPPEQTTAGAEITPAADIYAATAVLWFLLTGDHPPETDAIPAHLTSMPAAWQPLLERGLHHDPTLRYATVAEWAADARQVVDTGPATGYRPVKVGDTANLCPYKGMAAFQPEDAGLYFGREDMIETLVARLQGHSVLVIGGPSGSGKSSLLRAGLIPRLARGAIVGSQQWRVALFTPGSDAVGELIHQLRKLRTAVETEHLAPPTGAGPDIPGPTGHPAADQHSASDQTSAASHTPPASQTRAGSPPPGSDPLGRFDLPHGARRWLDDGPATILAIDQFEELFTLNPNRADQELFLDTLAAMTESTHSRIKIAIALRADFYGVCAAYPWLSDRINESQLLVGPMTRQELRDAIAIPAQRAGLRLEEGLADQIIDDVGGGGASSGGALPLLGHALMETWIRRRGSQLTLEGYRGAGGVSGAIAQRAEEILTQLPDSEQDAARRLLLQLINPGEGTPDTRRRVHRATLGAGVAPVMEKLASARLLTVDDEAVEVAHEALIQSWPRLRSWIDENRESLQTRRRLGSAAAEWEAQNRNPDLLYRGTQLAGALEWLDDNSDQLDETGTEFLTRARDLRDSAEQEQTARDARTRRNRHRAIGALAVLTVAAVIASALALVALRRSQSSQRAAEAQQVQALAAAAAGNASEQPLLATGLALESITRAEPSTAAGRSALVEARVGLDQTRWLPQPFGHPVNVGDMQAVAITPDGARFMTGGRAGEVVFWDRVTRTEIDRFEGAHQSGIQAITVSGDGRWMISTGGQQAMIWDLAADDVEPILLHEIDQGGASTIWDVAFSEDNSLVALATEGDGAIVLDRAGRSVIRDQILSEVFDLLSVAFLDNNRLAVGDGPGELHVVDIATGEPIGQSAVAGDNGNDVWELVVNRNLDLLTSVSSDNTVKSWNIGADGLSLQSVVADRSITDPGGVLSIRDGTELLIGAADGRFHRADPLTGELLAGGVSAELHTDELSDAGISENGWIVSLGDDQRVQVWRYVGNAALVDEVRVQGDPTVDLALSPSAEMVASSTADSTVVHDTTTGELIHRFAGGTASVAFVSEQLLVTGSENGLVQLWDLSRGALQGENAAHDGRPIRKLAVSEDGAVIVTGGADGTVVTWSGDDLEKLRELTAHSGEVTGVGFTQGQDTVVSLGWDQRIRFTPVGGGESQVITVDQDGPQALAVHHSQDLLAIGGSQERVDVLDFDGNLLREMAPHAGGVWDLAISDDGLSIAATSRGTGELQLWDWATGERLGPAFGEDYERKEPDVAITPDGVVWSGGLDGDIRRVDVLDEQVGCELSIDVMDFRMRELFLSSDDLMSCS